MYTNMLKVAVSDLPCFFCHVTCHMSPIFFQVLFISQNCTSQFCYPGGFTRVRSLGISKPRQMPDKSQVKPTAKAGHCSLLSMKQFQPHSSTSKLGFIWGRVSSPQCFEMEEMQRLRCSGYQKSGCGKIRSRA